MYMNQKITLSTPRVPLLSVTLPYVLEDLDFQGLELAECRITFVLVDGLAQRDHARQELLSDRAGDDSRQMVVRSKHFHVGDQDVDRLFGEWLA